jgi:hypothetical protein
MGEGAGIPLTGCPRRPGARSGPTTPCTTRRNGTGGVERPSASGCRSPDDAGGQPERDVRVRVWWEAAPTMAGPVGIVRRPEPTRTVPAGDDLFNLVVSPAFLVIAWAQVGCNRGARTAGVDGVTGHYIEMCAAWNHSLRPARCRSRHSGSLRIGCALVTTRPDWLAHELRAC